MAYRNQAVSITYDTLKLRQVIRRPVAIFADASTAHISGLAHNL